MKWTWQQRAEMKRVLTESLQEVMDELETYGCDLLYCCDQHDFKSELDIEFFRSTAERGIVYKLEKIAAKRKEMNSLLEEVNDLLELGNKEEEDED